MFVKSDGSVTVDNLQYVVTFLIMAAVVPGPEGSNKQQALRNDAVGMIKLTSACP